MRVVVAGGAGRTGRHIVRALAEDDRARLHGAVERADHPALGLDAGVVAGIGELGVQLRADLVGALEGAEALVDFSAPDAAAAAAEAAAGAGVALVIGTTGLGDEARSALRRAAESVPVVAAPNMSIGVNLVLDLLARAARILGPAYDFELFEMHHRGKVDAPSGTALRMAEVVAAERSWDLGEVARHGRSGAAGPRADEEIGILAARGGDVVGEHLAIFAGPAERVEIVHRAHGREAFARGAVRAALWTKGRAPGLYEMRDVLGQRTESEEAE